MARDIRYAFRRLLHNPGFSAVVVATLALGIGANTALFSIVNGVLLRPAALHQPDRLVAINHVYGETAQEAAFAVPTYRDLRERLRSLYLLATFAGLALLLSAIGIYGVMSYDVTRRSQELGLRLALGQARSSLLALVMRQGLVLALVGVAIGVAGAWSLTRVLEAQLYGVTRTDPATFAATALTLIVVAAVATLTAALRAIRMDPVRALRCE